MCNNIISFFTITSHSG